MQYIGPGDPDWAATVRAAAARQRAELDVTLPAWPVYGLADPPEPGWLAGFERHDGEPDRVELRYGADRLVVATERAGVWLRSLDYVLAARFAEDGREYPVRGELPPGRSDGLPDAPRAGPVELLVDGSPVPGQAQRVDGYLAARAAVAGVVVTLAGPELVALPALARVADLAGYVARRGAAVGAAGAAARAAAPPAPPLDGPDATEPLWAHRGLVAMTMAAHDEHARAHALHRPPGRPDPDWRRRWDAAVRRQQELRGQDRPDALDAVGAMVNQIGYLRDNAGWWADEALRQRAVNEIVWVTATGEENVPSAGAQRRWADERHAALAAWQDWADRNR